MINHPVLTESSCQSKISSSMWTFFLALYLDTLLCYVLYFYRDGSKLHPGLYPVLMVLGRLFNSALQGLNYCDQILAWTRPVLDRIQTIDYLTGLDQRRYQKIIAPQGLLISFCIALLEQFLHAYSNIKINFHILHFTHKSTCSYTIKIY